MIYVGTNIADDDALRKSFTTFRTRSHIRGVDQLLSITHKFSMKINGLT